MKELIKITENNGKKAVSARELYSFLGYDEGQYIRWQVNKIENNEFAIENIDYQYFDIDVEMPNGGKRKIYDCALSIEFAKKLCMIASTKKGDEARQYFINCEKQLLALPDFNNPAEAARAWANEYELKQLAESKVKELEPKAEVYDTISNATNLLTLNDAAKAIGIGRNIMMKILRDKDILRANNTPYQHYIDNHYFEVKIKTMLYKDQNYAQTFVTGRGLTWLTKILTK